MPSTETSATETGLPPHGLDPQLFAAFPLGLVIVDRKGIIRQSNEAALAISGELVCGKVWARIANRLIPPQQEDDHRIAIRDERRLQISTCPLPNRAGQLVIIVDLTESQNLQNAMDRHMRLEGMGQLLAALAHQLRTPLAASMLQANNLELFLGNGMTPEIHRILQELQMVLEQMENKINDVLLFARGGRVLHDILTPQRLLEELQSVLARENLRSIKTSCQGEFSTPARILICNRNSLISSVHNLINNAREAGADAIDIVLSEADRKLCIKIQDNGPGLDAGELENVLEPFYTTKSTGTGLGLPVVRLITEAHGGEMGISSQPDQGLCVTITLPLSDSITATAEHAV